MDLEIKKVVDLFLVEADFLVAEYGFGPPNIFISVYGCHFCYSKDNLGICFFFELRDQAVDTYFYDANAFPETKPPYENRIRAFDYIKKLGIKVNYLEFSKISTGDELTNIVLNAIHLLKFTAKPILENPKYIE